MSLNPPHKNQQNPTLLLCKPILQQHQSQKNDDRTTTHQIQHGKKSLFLTCFVSIVSILPLLVFAPLLSVPPFLGLLV
jgi:hypothetical protein